MSQPVAGNSRPHVSYGSYTNLGIHTSEGITNIIFHQPPSPLVFDLLRPDFVPDALYSSAKRQEEHAVTCQPETQAKILSDVRSWADSTTATPVCWLSGPAGTGKTTVAHTIAEEYDNRGQLAATFFFWRKMGDRDDINKVVATLGYQIANKIPSAKDRMEEKLKLKDASRDRVPLPLSNLSLEDQLSNVLIPKINLTDPNLIVIDGLDESSSRKGVCQLIEWIRKNKSPFRFLLTSRPEPELKYCFTSGLGDGHSDVRTLSLTESEDDIRMYFVKELEKVWPKQRRIEDGGPSQWPSKSDLNTLVAKSEGLFVYAATAVRYIGGEGFPQKRLKDIQNLYNGLDYLYAQVIGEAKTWVNFDIVMGNLMYLRYPLAIDDLSGTLLAIDDLSGTLLAFDEHLTSPGIRFALHRCHSILVIPDDNAQIKLYHASLRDFLTDQSRSDTLFHAPATCHGRLMFGCLSTITSAFSDRTRAPEYALVSWYYHACFFLSTGGASEGLDELGDGILQLVKKIDLNWVKSWMIEALYWAGLEYLKGDFPFAVQMDRGSKHWTRYLESKLRSIHVILEKFMVRVS